MLHTYIRYIIFALIFVWIVTPSIIHNQSEFTPKKPYQLLGWTSSKEAIKYAVIQEFGTKFAKITNCESGFKLKALNTGNKNGTIDTGLFQINQVHFKKAKQMGIDIHTIEGQFDYARHLIKRNGYRDWVCARKLKLI